MGERLRWVLLPINLAKQSIAINAKKVMRNK